MPDDDQKREPPQSPEAPPPPAEGEDAPTAAADRFRPEAIAERMDRIGSESDADRIAREEEQKLILRRRQAKGKRGGLEASASKRLQRIGDGTVRRPSAAGAYIPEADPLMDRMQRVRKWIEGHGAAFGAIVAAVVVAVVGGLGWMYWQDRRESEASALLARGFADEHGHVSDKEDEDDDDDARSRQLYPTFKTAADRRAAALAVYRQVEAKYPGSGPAILARLAEGGLLLDQGDAKGARAAYEDVKNSALARADAEVKGRALEGVGFSEEQLATTEAAAKAQHLDAALGAFKALESLDVLGFKELGEYHEARVYQEKGDDPKAVELLKNAYKGVTDAGASHPFSYLEFVIEDRLRALDPSALPPKPTRRLGAGSGIDTSDPQVQAILRQLQEQARKNGGGPAIPLAPSSAPSR